MNKKDLIFFSFISYESIYLLYTYLIADPLSLYLGADGFTDSETSFLVILFSIFLVPTFEELIFRSFLNKKLRYIWVLPMTVGLCGVIFYFFYSLVSLIFFIIMLVMLLIRLSLSVDRIKFILKNNFTLFFYFSSFLFAFVHIPAIHSKSIELTFNTKLIITTISILPISIILGRIRVLFGLRYSILLHCINNAMILIINSMFYQSI